MRRRPRRSRSAARPSSENGGSSTALSPTASMRQETACSPSRACRRANGAACAPPTLSSVCTRNSSDGSRPKPFCRQPTPLRCCSGRCWPQDRSTCARSMVGRPSPQNQSISRLTLLPETILSCSRRMRQTEFQPHSGRHLEPLAYRRDRELGIQQGYYPVGNGLGFFVDPIKTAISNDTPRNGDE